jgi:hypothetical protein
MHDDIFRPLPTRLALQPGDSTARTSDAGQNGFQVAAGVNLR